MKKQYLLASDFDQTLSFNDSGIILSELLDISGFREKVAALARLNLVQQGAELAYLLVHDPEYRRVTKADLVEVGRRVRLKRNVPLLTTMLARGINGHRFDFYVISAAPEEVVLAALDGIVPPDHVVGTRFGWDATSGQVASVVRVAAGYGKVAAVEELGSEPDPGPVRRPRTRDSGMGPCAHRLVDVPGWRRGRRRGGGINA